MSVTVFLIRRKKIGRREKIFDLFFYLAVWGVVGARLYDVFLIEWAYYRQNFWAVFKIWEGGLAIHGAILSGALFLWLWSGRQKQNFVAWADLLAPGLALGQAIGRWGNYFNQELFGQPTSSAWGLPIEWVNRPSGYESFAYFQPVFLYESVLNFILFLTLLFLGLKSRRVGLSAGFYLIGYGLIRFLTEFIRLDQTALFFGWRWPQLVSLILVMLGAVMVSKSRAAV